MLRLGVACIYCFEMDTPLLCDFRQASIEPWPGKPARRQAGERSSAAWGAGRGEGGRGGGAHQP